MGVREEAIFIHGVERGGREDMLLVHGQGPEHSMFLPPHRSSLWLSARLLSQLGGGSASPPQRPSPSSAPPQPALVGRTRRRGQRRQARWCADGEGRCSPKRADGPMVVVERRHRAPMDSTGGGGPSCRPPARGPSCCGRALGRRMLPTVRQRLVGTPSAIPSQPGSRHGSEQSDSLWETGRGHCPTRACRRRETASARASLRLFPAPDA